MRRFTGDLPIEDSGCGSSPSLWKKRGCSTSMAHSLRGGRGVESCDEMSVERLESSPRVLPYIVSEKSWRLGVMSMDGRVWSSVVCNYIVIVCNCNYLVFKCDGIFIVFESQLRSSKNDIVPTKLWRTTE